MKSVKTASTTPGFFVKVEQCLVCGGIWCDRYEMAQIAPEEADRIDPMAEKALKTPAEAKEDLKCPRCGELLFVLKDINIPPDAQISRCRQCEGIWLNKTELVSYKRYVRQRQIQNQPVNQEEYRSAPDTDREKAISAIGPLMMPIPYGSMVWGPPNRENPFVLSKHHVEILRQVPLEKKMEIYQIMADEHNKTIEEENRFINATTTILNIIFRLLLKYK